jgi:homoserine dehydrogenase
MIQPGQDANEPVHIVFRTHRAREAAVKEAIQEIDALDICSAPTVKIRLLNPE